MSLIPQYKKFKAGLLGYIEIPFDEFRHKILPLRARRTEWTPDETSYIKGLVSRGAGYSLQQLFGRNHKPAAAVIGSARLDHEPMAKPELDAHMANLVQNCGRAGWGPKRYVDFVKYLDSDMTPASLVAQDRERRRLAALANPARASAQGGRLGRRGGARARSLRRAVPHRGARVQAGGP